MEKALVGIGAPLLPESVRVNDSAVFELIGSESGQVGVKVELVERLSALPDFKKIVEHELFSRQVVYSGGEKQRTWASCHLLQVWWCGSWGTEGRQIERQEFFRL